MTMNTTVARANLITNKLQNTIKSLTPIREEIQKNLTDIQAEKTKFQVEMSATKQASMTIDKIVIQRQLEEEISKAKEDLMAYIAKFFLFF